MGLGLGFRRGIEERENEEGKLVIVLGEGN